VVRETDTFFFTCQKKVERRERKVRAEKKKNGEGAFLPTFFAENHSLGTWQLRTDVVEGGEEPRGAPRETTRGGDQ
jgi:hypothetical protein